MSRRLLTELKSRPPKRVLIACPSNARGQQDVEALSAELNQLGTETYRVTLPEAITEPETQLGEAIRQASWLGKASETTSVETAVELTDTRPDSVTDDAGSTENTDDVPAETASDIVVEDSIVLPPEPAEADPPAPVSVVPPAPEDIEAKVSDNEVLFELDGCHYRVRGLQNNLTGDQLKVNLLVTRGDLVHVDTLDLYASKPRSAFCRHASLELRVKEDEVKRHLAKILLKLETLQQDLIAEAVTPTNQPVELTPGQQREAMGLLTDPNLIERILADFHTCGVVGERTNLLTAYLATLSRKLDKPLAVMVQSTSAAGKSALMDNVLTMVPPEDRLQYSAMSGQSLFYMAHEDMRHKILAVSEEEGASKATYALKLLQSEGQLTIASTGKDPNTGRHTAHRYQVDGPVMLMMSTTDIDVDEELQNRCLVLSVSEDRDQTRAIHDQQRYQDTLAGLMAYRQRDEILRLHHNAQRLIRPLKVVNPFAPQLTFLDDKTRTRRDHTKYLTLIRTVALLHQHQREIKTAYYKGQPIEYLEVTRDDIRLANELAHEVFGRTLDTLPPQTRRLLQQIDALVEARCIAQGKCRRDLRFTRRDILDATHWGSTQLKVHLQRLEAEEYLLRHQGGRGQQIVYELLYRGEGHTGQPFLMGLVNPDTLVDPDRYATQLGVEPYRSATGRGQVGPKSGSENATIPGQINPLTEKEITMQEPHTHDTPTQSGSYDTDINEVTHD